jgi:hypothetical protein
LDKNHITSQTIGDPIYITFRAYIFYAPDSHLDYSNLFRDVQVEKVGNPGENVKTERVVENQTECHEIGPNLSKDIAKPEGYIVVPKSMK